MNQTYILNASSTLCCFTMAIEAVCTLLYSVFFQRVTSFLLQRFQFCDHWRCRKVPLRSRYSNRCFQSPDVARDATCFLCGLAHLQVPRVGRLTSCNAPLSLNTATPYTRTDPVSSGYCSSFTVEIVYKCCPAVSSAPHPLRSGGAGLPA